MHPKEKTIAAALSAVSAYLQLEQETQAGQDVRAAAPKSPPAASANVWGLSGRQTMMQIRDLMHLKAFNRFGNR
jgi:hypothetical protein